MVQEKEKNQKEDKKIADELKKLDSLPYPERVKKIKELLKKKKQEIDSLEALYNKSLRELSSRKQHQALPEQPQEEALEQKIEETPESSPKQSKIQEQPLETVISLYQRLRNYNELAQEGNLDYQTFTHALAVYQQLYEVQRQAETLMPYETRKQVEEIASFTKRIMKEISGSYLKDIMEYKGPEG